MTTPLPLRIADELEQIHPHEAAATLRAQHKLIGELVSALSDLDWAFMSHTRWSGELPVELNTTRAVLLKAKEHP